MEGFTNWDQHTDSSAAGDFDPLHTNAHRKPWHDAAAAVLRNGATMSSSSDSKPAGPSKPLQAGFFDRKPKTSSPDKPSDKANKARPPPVLAPGFLNKGSSSQSKSPRLPAHDFPSEPPVKHMRQYYSPMDFAELGSLQPGKDTKSPPETTVKFVKCWARLCQEHTGGERLRKMRDRLEDYIDMGLEASMEHYARCALPPCLHAAACTACGRLMKQDWCQVLHQCAYCHRRRCCQVLGCASVPKAARLWAAGRCW